MKTLRVLVLRVGRDSSAVALDHFLVGQGTNDANAIASLMLLVKHSVESDKFETLPEAGDEYQTRYNDSIRQSTTVRGEFLLQVRAAY